MILGFMSTSPNMHDLFDTLLRDMARANAQAPRLRPSVEGERVEILERGRRILGIEWSWKPRISTTITRRVHGDGYTVDCLQSTSWEGCRGSAHLYQPASDGPFPCVLLCCGHANGNVGKLGGTYQAMARMLVHSGIAVLVPDNLGQGERKAMGHQSVVKPFACGTSVQGLIVLETVAWLDWLVSQPQIRADALATIGNSGGGLLTMWLGAFAGGRLRAVCSSGYPSCITYIAQKEKAHCHCNILPGMVGSLEMWQLYGCVAPTPLYLFQGDTDEYFPVETFLSNARKTKHAFDLQGAADRMRYDVVVGAHKWDAQRIALTGKFLAPILETEFREPAGNESPLPAAELLCYPAWPDDALTTDQLAESVTGVKVPDGLHLGDVYGIPQVEDDPEFPLRGSARQVAAQFKAFTASGVR